MILTSACAARALARSIQNVPKPGNSWLGKSRVSMRIFRRATVQPLVNFFEKQFLIPQCSYIAVPKPLCIFTAFKAVECRGQIQSLWKWRGLAADPYWTSPDGTRLPQSPITLLQRNDASTHFVGQDKEAFVPCFLQLSQRLSGCMSPMRMSTLHWCFV